LGLSGSGEVYFTGFLPFISSFSFRKARPR